MISAIVLAAGLSRRMGSHKMILPWGETTVIGKVVSTLVQAGLDEILVVTGGAHREVEEALDGQPVRIVFNPHYEQGEMTVSLQTGLGRAAGESEGALVVLGDQPQIKTDVVERVVQEYRASRARLVVPSYRMRRGHPWLVTRDYWPEILALHPTETLRNFLNANSAQIHYVQVDSDSILRDLDTPEDYARDRPPDQPG